MGLKGNDAGWIEGWHGGAAGRGRTCRCDETRRRCARTWMQAWTNAWRVMRVRKDVLDRCRSDGKGWMEERNGRRTRRGKGGTKGTRSVRSFASEGTVVRVYHRATCRRRTHRIVSPDAFVCSSLQCARLFPTTCQSGRALFRPLSFLCVFPLVRIDENRGLDRDLFGWATGTCHPFVFGFRPGLLSWPLIGREVLPGAKVPEPQPLGWITSPRTGVSAIYVRKKEKKPYDRMDVGRDR